MKPKQWAVCRDCGNQGEIGTTDVDSFKRHRNGNLECMVCGNIKGAN